MPYYRITECSGLEGISMGHLVHPPAEAGSPTAGFTGLCPGGSWISPEKETPQPPWAACSSAPSPSEGRSSSSCSDGISVLEFVPVAPCPVAGHHWKESGPILLTPTLKIYMGIYKVPSQPSLLQAEQAQLPQPFLTGEMLQSPHHPCSTPLDSLQ